MRVARGINFKKTVIEIDLFENFSDIACVIADNLKDEFVDNICIEDRRSLFLEDRSSYHSKCFLNKCFGFFMAQMCKFCV